MTKLLYKELTGTIIGVYFDVYRGTARTYPEYIYEQAMLEDMRRKGIPCQRQPDYEVFYKDRRVGRQQLDLFVAGEVVVELKVAPQLTKLHKAQAISYLKVVGKQVSLLCNFGGSEPEFERLYFARPPPQGEPTVPPPLPTNCPEEFLSPELTYEVIGGLLDVHTILGPGFIHRIYANAAYHELKLRGLEVMPRREYQVIYRGRPIGGIKFNHLQVGGSLMVFPVAIQDVNDLSIDNLKAWMRVQKVPLAILANFYPDELDSVVLRTE
jgi:GxxExxY protein